MYTFQLSRVLIPCGLIILAILSCNFPTAEPQIQDVYLAKDSIGIQPSVLFEQDEIIYGIVELMDSPIESDLRALWIASDVEGIEPNFQITETEITTGSGVIHFELSNELPWPKGTYQLNLYFNGELERILEFDIQ